MHRSGGFGEVEQSLQKLAGEKLGLKELKARLLFFFLVPCCL
jgi:hypothetical protein